MNKNILVVVAIIIPFVLIFLYGLNDYYDVSIHVFKLDNIPTNYINMTSQQLDDFPNLNKALIQGEESVKPPRDEWERLGDFLDEYGHYVKFQNDYYGIWLGTP